MGHERWGFLTPGTHGPDEAILVEAGHIVFLSCLRALLRRTIARSAEAGSFRFSSNNSKRLCNLPRSRVGRRETCLEWSSGDTASPLKWRLQPDCHLGLLSASVCWGARFRENIQNNCLKDPKPKMCCVPDSTRDWNEKLIFPVPSVGVDSKLDDYAELLFSVRPRTKLN